MSPNSPRLKDDLLNVVRGFLMGGADIIPGVSGGTVALIVGVYERLITAISHVDTTLFSHIKNGEWTSAARHLDLRLLIPLGLGIGMGILAMAGVMHELLLHQRQWTLAVFFGLIAASAWLVARIVERWTASNIGLLLIGMGGAFLLVGLPLLQNPPDHLAYLFFCGMIAICAMILPGISGSFILLLLGKYADVTGIIKGLPKGEFSTQSLLQLGCFGAGCLVGIIGFSKLLRWLLARHESATMAFLCGLMIGSLRKLWPFQQDLTPEIEELKHKVYSNLSLADVSLTGQLIPVVVVILLAGTAVLLLDYIARRFAYDPETELEQAAESVDKLEDGKEK